MVSLEEARQQVATARQLVAEKKAQAEQVQTQLEQQEQSLPSTTSQMALRQKFKGIQGRIQRRAIDEQRGEIQEQQGYVKSYKDELGKYEQDISATEVQISDYERKYSELQSDAREEARAELEAYKQEFEADNPGEKLIVDWSKLRIKGVSSDTLGQSLSVDAYNKRIEDINTKLDTTLSAPSINKINTQLPRNERIAVPKQEIRGGLFTSVSAQPVSINPNTNRPYGVLSKAPSFKERFKESTKDSFVGGAVGFVGGMISQESFNIQQRKYKSGDTSALYQSTAIQSAAAQSPDLLLRSIPVSRVIYPIAKGTEDIIRNIPKVKSEPSESLTKIGYGVLDVGSGTLIGASGIKNARLNREARALEKAPTTVRGVRFENGKRGVDVVFGIKSTQPKGIMDKVLQVRPQTAVSRIEQPFFNTKRGAVFEDGRAYSIVLKEGKDKVYFSSAAFKQSGRAIKAPKATAVRQSNSNYIRKNLDVDTALGKVRMRKAVENTGTISKNNNPLFSDEFIVKQQTERFGGKDYEDIFFGGFSKKSPTNKNIINVMSGKVEKIRYIGDGFYKPKAIVRPNVKGKIRVFRIDKRKIRRTEGWDMRIGGMGKKSNRPIYLQQKSQNIFPSIETASRSISKTVAKPKQEAFSSPLIRQEQSQWYGKGAYERTESVSAGGIKEDTFGITSFVETPTFREAQRSNQRIRQQPKTKQKEDVFSGFNEAFGLRTPQSTKQPQRISQQYRQQQKQGQGTTQTFNWLTGERINTPRTTGGFNPSVSYRTSKGRILHSAPGRFVIVVKRYGVDSVIGEAATLAEAKQILSYNLKSTLGASGFISSGGRKQDVSGLWGNMFTRAKKDPFRLVQRRGKRLSSRSEVGEIMGFNRVKGRSKAPRRIKWFS